MISIHMSKMSGDAIIKPLFTISKNCLKGGVFPDEWKKGNIVPMLKKATNKTSKLLSNFSSSNLKQDFGAYHKQ